jgi:glycosyltransferase 2 family protein
MKSQIRNYVLSAVVTIGFLYLSFRGVDLSQVYLYIRQANPWWILVMLASLMTSHVFRTLRWRSLLEPVKNRCGFRNLFSSIMIGYIVNNLIPRAGELVRPIALARKEHLPAGTVLGTVVVERLLDMFALVVILILLPVVYDGPLMEAFPWLAKSGVIASIFLSVITLVFVVLMANRELTRRTFLFLTKFLPSKISERINGLADSFLDGFLFLKHPKTFVRLLATSVMIWSLYGVMMYAGFYAFGLQHSLGVQAAIVVLGISNIGVALPTPGAVGTYHFFTMQALVRLFSISSEVSIGYATVTHAVGFISATLLGGYFAWRDGTGISVLMKDSKTSQDAESNADMLSKDKKATAIS